MHLTNKIEQWAMDKDLHTADPNKQILKVEEEFGEICEGMAKGRHVAVKDAIGDMYVDLTIISMQLELSVRDCIEIAYRESKDIKGEMIDGVFVKDSDI